MKSDYIVEAYHRVKVTYRVSADSEANAIGKLEGLLRQDFTEVSFTLDPTEMEKRGVLALDWSVDQTNSPAPTGYETSTPQNQFEDKWILRTEP